VGPREAGAQGDAFCGAGEEEAGAVENDYSVAGVEYFLGLVRVGCWGKLGVEKWKGEKRTWAC
jgi:hypothetical protein